MQNTGKLNTYITENGTRLKLCGRVSCRLCELQCSSSATIQGNIAQMKAQRCYALPGSHSVKEGNGLRQVRLSNK